MSLIRRGILAGDRAADQMIERSRRLEDKSMHSLNTILDERQLPASLDAERSILGAIILGSTCHSEVVANLAADDFYREAHQQIYAQVIELLRRGEPVDEITLAEELRRRDKLEAVGGLAYLSSLIDGVPDRPSVMHYVRMV